MTRMEVIWLNMLKTCFIQSLDREPLHRQKKRSFITAILVRPSPVLWLDIPSEKKGLQWFARISEEKKYAHNSWTMSRNKWEITCNCQWKFPIINNIRKAKSPVVINQQQWTMIYTGNFYHHSSLVAQTLSIYACCGWNSENAKKLISWTWNWKLNPFHRSTFHLRFRMPAPRISSPES